MTTATQAPSKAAAENPNPAQMVAGTPPPVEPAATNRKTSEERKETLARQIQSSAAQGARVETQSDFQAIVTKGKPVNHVLHGIVSLLTLGLWLPVWLVLALTGGEKRQMLLVDEWGSPSIQQL